MLANGGIETQNATGSVQTALDMVNEELVGLIDRARDEGARAFRAGNTATFDKIKEQCQAFEGFQERFNALYAEWRALARGRRKRRKTKRQAGGPRASRGELLLERAYVFPILQVLKDAGGSADARPVLAGVGRIVGNRLCAKDKEPLTTGQIRWENRAHWVRKYLVRAGLLSPNSPRGVWEITPQGLAHLDKGDLDSTWDLLMAAKRRGR